MRATRACPVGPQLSSASRAPEAIAPTQPRNAVGNGPELCFRVVDNTKPVEGEDSR